MSECPQGTCNGLETVKTGLHEKVDRTSASKWVMGLIGYGITLLLALGIAWGSLRIEVTRNSTHFEHISKTMDDIQTTQKAMWKVIKELND